MPAVVAIPYFVIEILAFTAVVMWLGIGWAIGLLFLAFFGGLVLAAVEMRRISRAAALAQKSGQGSAGAIAGNFGLTAAGAILVVMPGFVSSIIGLLLMIPPTRMLIRRTLAKRLRTTIENLGVKGFEAANGYRPQASYGGFGGSSMGARDKSGATDNGAPIVLDEEEIQEWTAELKPEDFGSPTQQPSRDDDPDSGDSGDSADDKTNGEGK